MPTASDPLQELRDVHMPDPISWWPLAWGWWMVAGSLIIVGGLALWAWLYRQRTQSRRAALVQLGRVKEQYATQADDHWAIVQLSHLVRRYALATFPRSQVAGLSGQAWLQFLDHTGQTNQFSHGPGQSLGSGPFQPQGSGSVADLIPLIERWIKNVQRGSKVSSV